MTKQEFDKLCSWFSETDNNLVLYSVHINTPNTIPLLNVEECILVKDWRNINPKDSFNNYLPIKFFININ